MTESMKTSCKSGNYFVFFLCAMTTRMKKGHVASDNGRIRPLTFHYRYSGFFFGFVKLQSAACAPHLICSLPNLHVATPE